MMKVVEGEGGWWIEGVPPYEYKDSNGNITSSDKYGPYSRKEYTKTEVNKIRRGLEQTIKEIDRWDGRTQKKSD